MSFAPIFNQTFSNEEWCSDDYKDLTFKFYQYDKRTKITVAVLKAQCGN
jgi:activator of HSP90 ATPase